MQDLKITDQIAGLVNGKPNHCTVLTSVYFGPSFFNLERHFSDPAFSVALFKNEKNTSQQVHEREL